MSISLKQTVLSPQDPAPTLLDLTEPKFLVLEAETEKSTASHNKTHQKRQQDSFSTIPNELQSREPRQC